MTENGRAPAGQEWPGGVDGRTPAGPGGSGGLDVARLRAAARDARRLVLQAARLHGTGHPGGSLSACDLLAAIFLHARRPGVDRFVLGKAHAQAAHHALLALTGAFPISELAAATAARPGVDFPPGPPGQGLAAGVGLALAAQRAGSDARTYVLLGDGEAQAGAVWEAAQVAARHGLDRLVAIIDQNRRSGDPTGPEPLEKPAARFRAFGWHVIELNGHDMDRIVAGFAEAARASGKPVVMIAATTKGQGVSFMLDDPAWHARVPSADELRVALAELGGDLWLAASADAPQAPGPATDAGGPLRPGAGPVADAALAGGAGPAADAALPVGAALAALDDPALVLLDADQGGLPGFPAGRTIRLGVTPATLPAIAAGLAAAGLAPWAVVDALPAPWPAGRVKLIGPAGLVATLPAHVPHAAPQDLARLHAEPGPGFLALPAEAPLAACR